jgi:lambda family phage portal protein
MAADLSYKGSVVLRDWMNQRRAQRAWGPPRDHVQVRRYDAAAQTRLTFGWTTQNTTLDTELRMDLDALRARARDLVANNDYARKFLSMVVTNVVGPNGFALQSLAARPDGQPDNADRSAIESAWAEWSRAGECDVTGRHSFADLCRLAMRAVARDGECLIRRVRDRRFAFGYRLQVLDIDRLDVRHWEALPNGNKIVMGVELDPWGRPAAYWLLTRHPGDRMPLGSGTETPTRERVPADDMFHLFIAERPEQTRGVPWMHTAMLRLQMLGGYEEAAIVAARTGAAKMGFFVSPDGTAKDIADSRAGIRPSDGTAKDIADGQDAGQFITDAEAGSFGILPEGYDFKPWSPEYPTQNYDAFVKSCLRGLASGLNVAYNTLANDLEGVNFSSIRSGTLEERDHWMVVQGWFVETFLRPLFLDWLEVALLKGAIVMPNGFALPAGKLGKFRVHGWQGRRWQWVDPLKDMQTAVLAIEKKLMSPQQVAAQMGVDLEDVIAALQTANQMAEAAGLPGYVGAPEAPPKADTGE